MRSLFASLFRRASAAGLSAWSGAESAPTSGLIRIDYKASAGGGVLEALVDGAVILRRKLAAGEGPVEGWFAVHGHLLPNGETRLTLRLNSAVERTLTLKVRNEGALAAQVAASLKARKAPLAVDGPCDSRHYDYADPSLKPWFDRTPAEIEAHLAGLTERGEATFEEVEVLRVFADQGYMVLPDAIDPAHLVRLNAALDDAVENKVDGYEWGKSQRIHNLHQRYDAVRDLWVHPKVMRMLGLVFEAPARPCQSLTYVFGSEQEHHQDTIHLTPFPAGRMCGVWTALEDVQPESGELMVFPRSQHLPRVYMADVGVAKVENDEWDEFGRVVTPRWTDMINAAGLAPEPYRPKAGTVLIWHENLMHAGSPRRDLSKSRRSIVGHYFAGGAIAYYDSSGQPASLHEAS
ncbi:MAG: hypothetical protein DI570_06755 [Phenylobacterium zucineum]|nr:MAG: hypothetical protein DI570_06755 [Phenylobacterium zucineum]